MEYIVYFFQYLNKKPEKRERKVMNSARLIRIVTGILFILILVQGVQAAKPQPVTNYVFVKQWDGWDAGSFLPWGLAVDTIHGWVYVGDHVSNYVQKFDTNGDRLLSGPWVIENWGIAVDNDGMFYTDTNAIYKHSPDGSPIGDPIGAMELSGTRGLAVDKNGNIYVAQWSTNTIRKYSASGTLLKSWGSFGTGDAQFNGPEGVAVNSTGDFVYVTDHENNRVQKFDSEGTFILKWGTSGSNRDGQFNGPEGIAVDNEGYVYVTDVSNFRVQKFDASGKFITKWGAFGTAQGQFTSPSGIAVDAAGNVFVSDYETNRIQKFAPTTTVTPVFSATPQSGTVPLTVQFTDQSTGAITDYRWYFDNDDIIDNRSQNPSFTFTTAGVYDVKLTVVGLGVLNEKSATKTITVSTAAPTISWTKPGDIIYGTPLGISQLNAEATGYDGSTVTGTFSYVPGADTILDAGDNPLTVTFIPTDMNYHEVSGSTSITVNPFTPSIVWVKPESIIEGTPLGDTQLNARALGYDGTTEVTGTYVYTPAAGEILAAGSHNLNVAFSPTDANYNDATGSTSITVLDAPPVAGFSSDPPSGGTVPLNVHFTSESTGAITSFAWDFDDDGTIDSTESSPSHEFTPAGSYRVNLTVTGPGGSDTIHEAIVVAEVTQEQAADKGIDEILEGVLDEATVSVTEILPEGTCLYQNGENEPFCIPSNGYVIVIDHCLRLSDTVCIAADGDHQVELFHVDTATGCWTVFNANSEPTNIETTWYSGQIQNPWGDPNSVGSSTQNPGGGLGAVDLVPACAKMDCSHNYALLVDGGINYTQNAIRY
jgi:tripartite motif-containing protein 71